MSGSRKAVAAGSPIMRERLPAGGRLRHGVQRADEYLESGRSPEWVHRRKPGSCSIEVERRLLFMGVGRGIPRVPPMGAPRVVAAEMILTSMATP